MTIAASAAAIGCTTTDEPSPPTSTADTMPEAESCGASVRGNACSLEGQLCSDCPHSPYGLTCQGGTWTAVDLHGSCNPPGWPFDTGTPIVDDTGFDATTSDATIGDGDASD